LILGAKLTINNQMIAIIITNKGRVMVHKDFPYAWCINNINKQLIEREERTQNIISPLFHYINGFHYN
jgi:hypothetical protein